MIVHRDYRDSGNSIIKIFDDIATEKLNSGGYPSRTRNRAIARAFKEAGIIEKYGLGIARIKDECRLHSIKKPVFEEFVHGFRVTLYKEKLNVGTNELHEFIKNHQPVRVSTMKEHFNKVITRTIERWINS